MIKYLLGVGIAASALLVATPPAVAAEAPSCAAALVAYSDAAKAAATAASDDQAAKDAQAAVDLAVKAATSHADWPAGTAVDEAEKGRLLAATPTDDEHKASIAARVKLIDAVLDARALLKTADETAAETDAADLALKANRARVAADAACKGKDGEPTATVTPAPDAPAAPQVVVVPDTSNGVDTGSW